VKGLRGIAGLVAALLALSSGLTVARAAVGERQVLALVRALAYDHQLGERAGDDVRVGVAYAPEHAAAARAVLDVLDGLSGVTIQDRPLSSVGVPYAEAGALTRALEDGVDVVLVMGDGRAAAEIVRAVHGAGAVTAGFEPSLLAVGVPLVVSDESGDLEVYVNLPASRAAGQSFSSKLLQIATVVREAP